MFGPSNFNAEDIDDFLLGQVLIVGGTLTGTPAGHRYTAALGLALAGNG
jgi:hypothetical protein